MCFHLAKKNIFDDDPFQKTKSGAREYLQAIEERGKSILNVNDYKELMKRIKDVSTILFSRGWGTRWPVQPDWGTLAWAIFF